MLRSEYRRPTARDVAEIIRDAGGEFVGWARLHKTAYLLELCGFGAGFEFESPPYGPSSEQLELAARSARALGLIQEEEHKADWGGFYSIFRSSAPPPAGAAATPRSKFIRLAAEAHVFEVDLAATAAFASRLRYPDPWDEAVKRKRSLARDGHLANAKALYRRLMQVETPRALPQIV